MFLRADKVRRGDTLQCDVCIVGAGAAGITIAQELVDSRLKVILLESGALRGDAETQSLAEGRTRGTEQTPLDQSRLRLFGGTTNHWAGICRPLDELDFLERSWVPDSGWPISRQSLEAYYRRAHPVCDLGPYDYGDAAWSRNIDPDDLFARADIVLKLVRYSKPTRFGTKFRRTLNRSNSMRVVLNANVTEIVPDPTVQTVRSVDVRTLAGNHFSVGARAFVIACGGIENARLLLLSDRFTRRGLGNDGDRVGRYYMDHLGTKYVGLMLHFDETMVRVATPSDYAGVGSKIGLGMTSEALTRERLLNHVMYIQQPQPLERMKAGAEIFGKHWDLSSVERVGEQTPPFLRLLGKARGSKLSLCYMESEPSPNPASRVTLSDEIDRLEQRKLIVDWQLHDPDYASISRAAQTYAQVVGRYGLGRMSLVRWLRDPKAERDRRVFPAQHHMGTTRMADSPSRGVVDSDCKIFGLDNTYIAGSSVFPTTGYINPTLTIVALSLRLADHLRGTL